MIDNREMGVGTREYVQDDTKDYLAKLDAWPRTAHLAVGGVEGMGKNVSP